MLPKKYIKSNRKIFQCYYKNHLVICKTAINFFTIKKEFQNIVNKYKNIDGLFDIMGGISPLLNCSFKKRKIYYDISNNFRNAAKNFNPTIISLKKIPEIENHLIFINKDLFNLRLKETSYKLLKEIAFHNILYVYSYKHDKRDEITYLKRNRGLFNQIEVSKNFKFFSNFMHMGFKITKTKSLEIIKLKPNY